MARKKKKDDGGGIPEWVVTFGDMMSLLLCFFILLQMFSELKRDHEYQRVITAVKEAFGFNGGVGVLPIDDIPLKSVVEQLETIAQKTSEDVKFSQNPEESMEGRHMRVTRVREGIQFTIGGPAHFDEGSAVVKPALRTELERLVTLMAGRNNKITIRGHAAAKYLPSGSPWADLDDLSYARAKNVKDVLVELGLRDPVFRLEAVGTREPVRPRAMQAAEVAENRRVEIIMTEELVEENNVDAQFSDPNLARGA